MTAIPTFAVKATMSSREIAQETGKQHYHILEAIRAMEPAWEKINQSKFRLVDYIDAKGERRPEYQLSKLECLYIATKFNDEARARLIIRWEKLENAQPKAIDFSHPETVLQLAQNWAEERRMREAVEERLKIAEPKALFADAVSASPDCILVRELAKILCQNGIETGEKRLYEWFRQNGYVIAKVGKDRNTPTQRSSQMGLLIYRESAHINSKGESIVTKTTYVTTKGQQYFVNKFLNQNNIEQ